MLGAASQDCRRYAPKVFVGTDCWCYWQVAHEAGNDLIMYQRTGRTKDQAELVRARGETVQARTRGAGQVDAGPLHVPPQRAPHLGQPSMQTELHAA